MDELWTLQDMGGVLRDSPHLRRQRGGSVWSGQTMQKSSQKSLRAALTATPEFQVKHTHLVTENVLFFRETSSTGEW